VLRSSPEASTLNGGTGKRAHSLALKKRRNLPVGYVAKSGMVEKNSPPPFTAKKATALPSFSTQGKIVIDLSRNSKKIH